MRRGLILLVGAILAFGALAGDQQKDIGVRAPAGVGRQAGYADSWALVIGIDHYQHPGIERLGAAVNNAQAMEAFWLSPGSSRMICLFSSRKRG